MILKLLKTNRAINLIIFPAIGVLLWLKRFLQPTPYPFFEGENQNVLYAPISNWTDGRGFLSVLLSLVLVILLAFLVQQVNDRFSFIRARTKLPAIMFVILVGGFTAMHTLHPVLLSAIFLVLGIYNLFSIFNHPNPLSGIFNSGFLLAVGSLFYFNLVAILPAFLFSIPILRREINWREYVVLLIGFAVPVIFAVSFMFYTDRIETLLVVSKQNIFTAVNHFKGDYFLYAYLAFLVVLTIFGSFKLLQQYDSRKVSSRKYYAVFLMIFSFSVLSFVLVPATSQEMLIISTIPVTFLVSNFFVSIESKLWGESLFSILLFAVAFMQIAG